MAAPELSPTALARLSAQLLTGAPARSAGAVVERLLAVQAQDPRGFRLAVRVRSAGLHVSDVERELDAGDLVVSWLNRGTLHLVRREDFWWLHALTTPPLFTANTTRLRQEGVSSDAAERGVATVARSLAHGPLLRAELRERLDAAGVPTAGQALVHLLVLASLRGLIVRGPMRGREQAFVLAADWVGAPPAVDRDAALAELARRYLRGHAPASDRDLARWAGLPLRDARAGLAAVSAELRERGDELVELRTSRRPRSQLPPPRLLGAFDPLLLGWTSRDDVLTHDATRRLVTSNGLFRPFALVGGRAVATWSYAAGRVQLTPLLDVSPSDLAALEADAAAVTVYLDPRG